MGTSLEQLSQTYAHLLPDSADRARAALNAFITEAARERSPNAEAFADFVRTFRAASGPQTQSGRADSNRRPLVPQTSALTRLRHAPPRER